MGGKNQGVGEDIFEEFEKFFTGGQSKKRGSSKPTAKGNDIILSMEIDFMDAVNGISKQVSFARVDVCGTCKGSRARPGT
jgi:molecular chaperone DnaJ